MQINIVRNYYDFIIVCDNFTDLYDIMNSMMEKVRCSGELESFNIASKVKYLYLTDGSKYKFTTERYFAKLRMKGEVISADTFAGIIDGFDPTLKKFVDIMHIRMINI